MYIHRHNNKSALLAEYTCFQVLQDGGGSVVYSSSLFFFKCMVLMMVTLVRTVTPSRQLSWLGSDIIYMPCVYSAYLLPVILVL